MLSERSDFPGKESIRAYSNLTSAMSLVKEREKSMGFVSLACKKLQASEVCTIGSIYKFYKSLVKMAEDRRNPKPTRNLRLYSEVDHGKMLELKMNVIRHIDLLGNIRSLDENLRTTVKGISNYFGKLATYDQRIAATDVEFLAHKLEEFDRNAAKLSEKVEKDLSSAMKTMMIAVGSQVIEEFFILKLKIGEHLNPMKVIFGGVEAADFYEQIAEITRSIRKAFKGIALMENLTSAYNDTASLAKDFKENADQISNLTGIVDAIKKKRVDEIGFDADKFIKAYGAYTPKINKNRLAHNDALWAAFKDSTCEPLLGAEGVGGSIVEVEAHVVKAVPGGMLFCEKLEGSLAEFATLRENIFDYQFDLVDALARVIRGNVAKKLAQSITVSNDLLDASQLMLGFFMTQYRLQSHAALYCDKLEYLNKGNY